MLAAGPLSNLRLQPLPPPTPRPTAGVINGWLPHADYDAVVRLAWVGLAGQVADDGTVSGICEGTGILTSVAEYAARATPYAVSSPGLGGVFRATLAYDAYVQAFGQ